MILYRSLLYNATILYDIYHLTMLMVKHWGSVHIFEISHLKIPPHSRFHPKKCPESLNIIVAIACLSKTKQKVE